MALQRLQLTLSHLSPSLNPPTRTRDSLADTPNKELAYTVFCGSSPGNDPVYADAADSVGRAFARAGVTLIYGGGTAGVMGQVSSRTLDHGGKVHGIIPSAFLANEAPDRGPLRPNEEETIVDSMHQRKKLMADLSEGFIGLPGGYGTLEEVAEMTTWSQIGVHLKPVVLLNVNGFYSSLREFINNAISSGFIFESNRAFLVFVDGPSTANPLPSSFDWGQAALEAIRRWKELGSGGATPYSFEWTKEQKDGTEVL
ncbi:hypothetical protein JCM8208_007870 [Rhodotorula glutinis]